MIARLRRGEQIPEGHWLVTDRQTQGKGRQGRQWMDAPGNFMGSTVLRLHPQREPPPASLGFAASLAVYEVLASQLAIPQSLQLKWPNDVMLSGAKLAGLLLQRESDCIVIGIGVNLSEAPHVAGRRTASTAGCGPAISRDGFADSLASQMAVECNRWRDFGLEAILRRWSAAAHLPGTRLCVHGENGEIVRGTFAALAEDGALILRLPDGATSVIHAGDVMLEDG